MGAARLTSNRWAFIIMAVGLICILVGIIFLVRAEPIPPTPPKPKPIATKKPEVTSETAKPTPQKPAAKPAPVCANQTGGNQPKQLWVWQYTTATDTNQKAALFAFAGSRKVQTIFLESEKLLSTNQAALAAFIAEAKQHCINVELLFGAPDWAFTRNHPYAVSLASQAVAFAHRVAVPPVGVQFDVEPYNLAEYKADQNAGANQYLDLLDKIRAVTAPSKLYFAKAMPLGFEFQSVTRNGQTQPLSHAAIARVDRVVLMDYRDTASRIIPDAADEIAVAARYGKKLVIGLETDCQTGEVHTITFCEEGNGALEAAIAQVIGAYAGNAAFAGVAVHQYDTYRSLKP